jgi:hypothetical protein
MSCVCTRYKRCIYSSCTYSVHAITGFRGSRRDEDIQAGGPVSTQPPVTDDEERDYNPCSEDEEFFQGRPDADAMEEAIAKFLDGWNGVARAQRLQGPAQISWSSSGQCRTSRLYRAASFQRWMLRNRKHSHRQNYSCTDMHWNTGTCTVYIHCTYIVHAL